MRWKFLKQKENSQNKRGLFVTLYHSLSQSHNCFQSFHKEFETLFSSITKKRTDCTIITEGTNIKALTFYHGFEQVINERTHILPNSVSYTDLIFANKPNLIVESGVVPSLHGKCHHQIVYWKLNLNVA